MFRKLLISAAAIATMAPGMANAAWYEASSKHFVVYSNDSPENVKAYTQKLERFDKAISVWHMTKETPRGPASRVTIFVVDNVAAIQKLSGPGVAGFYQSRASGPTAFMPRYSSSGDGMTPQAIMFHEYTHHWMFLNWSDASFPYWFTEGFAELHATAIASPDGTITFGANPLYRRYTVERGGLMPAPDLLSVKPSDDLDGAAIDAVYSRGWLLMHYLTFSADRRKQLADYIGAINGGKTPQEAGKILNANGLDAKMNAWGAQRRYPSAQFKAAELPIGDVALRPLTAGEVAAMPALLQSRAGVDARKSRDVVALARKIAASMPGDPYVLNELAEAEYDYAGLLPEKDADVVPGYQRAEAAADRALAADPKSMHALLYKGMAQEAVLAKNKVTDPARWATARKWFLIANKLDPEHPEPLIQFYDSFKLAEVKPTTNAENGVIYAYLLAPFDGGLRMRATRAYLGQNKLKEARIALGPVIYSLEDRALGGQARKLQAAMDAGDIPAAIKILDAKPEDKDKKKS